MSTQTKIWTYQDYLAIEDTNRYEIINGDLIMAPAPRSQHQKIIQIIDRLFFLHLKEDVGALYLSPIDVIFSEEEVLQPDLLFILKANEGIIQERGIFGVPDLIIEILSPSTAAYDRKEKFQIYEKHKVKEYWIVDYANETIERYNFDGKRFILEQVFVKKDNFQSKLLSLEFQMKEIIKD